MRENGRTYANPELQSDIAARKVLNSLLQTLYPTGFARIWSP